jgi:hypothetical protein
MAGSQTHALVVLWAVVPIYNRQDSKAFSKLWRALCGNAAIWLSEVQIRGGLV